MKKWLDDVLWYSRGYRHDKPKHFWYLGVFPSTIMFLLTWFHFFRDKDWRYVLTEACVLGIGVVAGFAKDILDWWQGKQGMKDKYFDWVDVQATIYGSVYVTVLTSVSILIAKGIELLVNII